jgi:4-hydroxy-tetrahydrodipicolinate synthase
MSLTEPKIGRWEWSEVLRGVVPPIITPLKQNGEMDEAAAAALVEHVLEAGCSGIFAIGGCGLGPWLTTEERSVALHAVVAAADGRVPVLAGCMLPATGPTREAARRAEAEGADAIVAGTPYYNSVGAAEQQRHIEAILAAVNLPVVLYNIPQCTTYPIYPEAVAGLAREPRVLGIKDTSGDLTVFQSHLAVKKQRPDFRVLQGAERVMAVSMLVGGDGLIAGLANVAPRYFVDLVRAGHRGDIQTCLQLQEHITDLYSLFFQGQLLAALIAACADLGFGSGRPSEPYETPNAAQREEIRAVLRRHGLLKAIPALSL